MATARSEAQTPQKAVNLALQGGGSHGAFTWGVLDTLLDDGRIDFVVLGPHERALGDFSPVTAPYLHLRYAAGAYSVYEVVR